MIDMKTGRLAFDTTEYGPEHLHTITFGAVHGTSMAARLTPMNERSDLATASGRFAQLRESTQMRNDTLYSYLRLGVSTQSAAALQVMGYPTPESLTESEVTSALLPDHLAFDGELPLRFINACESEGISAMECQYALRRGVLDEHMDGAIEVRHLVHAFRNYVSGKKRHTDPSKRSPHGIDFIIDGTIPFDTVSKVSASVSELNCIGPVFSEQAHRPIVQSLRYDAALFNRFLRPLATSHSKEVIYRLLDSIEAYGWEVLDLGNPLCCGLPLSEEGNTGTVCLETVRYMEEMMANLKHLVLGYGRGYVGPEGLRYRSGAQITYKEFDDLRKSGMSADTASLLIFESGMAPESALFAYDKEVPASLMAGVL